MDISHNRVDIDFSQNPSVTKRYVLDPLWSSSESEHLPKIRDSKKRHRKQHVPTFDPKSRPLHPFAERPSPWEEWQQTITLGLTTFFQFLLFDIFANGVLHYTWQAIQFILLSPIALLGLMVD